MGPSDPTRSATSTELLPAARAAAEAAGVTRLAELTRLDRLGLPVWQAVRPMSRALSVHQGKGATDADAQIGALLEAVESHHAETFDAEGPICPFDALPEHERAPTFSDFARDRDAPPNVDDEHRWTRATELVSGGSIYLPFDVVSLDTTVSVSSAFDRASSGVAAGASRDEAIVVALQELIERDAVGEWRARGVIACTADTLRLDTVPFDWFREWRDRVARAGMFMRVYFVPSIAGTPVFVCELNDLGKGGAPYRATHGSGCHPLPEIALFKALAEAIQARATYIAGAREDLLPSDYADHVAGSIRVAFGLPLSPGMRGVAWGHIEAGPIGVAAAVGALARAGYDRIALVDLGNPEGFSIVRAFVCGLGSTIRRRRPVVR